MDPEEKDKGGAPAEPNKDSPPPKPDNDPPPQSGDDGGDPYGNSNDPPDDESMDPMTKGLLDYAKETIEKGKKKAGEDTEPEKKPKAEKNEAEPDPDKPPAKGKDTDPPDDDSDPEKKPAKKKVAVKFTKPGEKDKKDGRENLSPEQRQALERTESRAPQTEEDFRKILREELAKIQEQKDSKPKGTKPDDGPDPDEDLLPQEKEAVELAKFAEKDDPDSYKGFEKRMRQFIQKNRQYLERKQKDDPDYNPREDEEYQEWVKQENPMGSEDKKKIERRQIENSAYEKAREANRKEFDELKKNQQRVEKEPEIKQHVSSFEQELIDKMPQDVVEHLREHKDMQKTYDEFPVEAEVITALTNDATRIADEFLRFSNGLTKWDPRNNKAHEFIGTFLKEQSDIFQKQGGDARVRNGKTFMSPFEFKESEHGDKHWTFDDQDFLAMLQHNVAQEAERRIKAENDRLEKINKARERRGAAKKKPSGGNDKPSGKDTDPEKTPDGGKKPEGDKGGDPPDDDSGGSALPVSRTPGNAPNGAAQEDLLTKVLQTRDTTPEFAVDQE